MWNGLALFTVNLDCANELSFLKLGVYFETSYNVQEMKNLHKIYVRAMDFLWVLLIFRGSLQKETTAMVLSLRFKIMRQGVRKSEEKV